MKCTWADCENEAETPLFGSSGQEWAKLCATHVAAFNEAMEQREARSLVSVWTKAGYSHPARREFVERAAKTGAKLFAQLSRKDKS